MDGDASPKELRKLHDVNQREMVGGDKRHDADRTKVDDMYDKNTASHISPGGSGDEAPLTVR